MKKQFILCFVATAILLSFNSCKTDDEPSIEAQPVYLPMSVGNYWIYQNFIVDSLGNERPLNSFDSVVITNDTLINNKLYYEFGGKQNYSPFHKFLRDSVGYLVTINGKKTFSIYNFKDTLQEQNDYLEFNKINRLISTFKIKMESVPEIKTTAAGDFTTLNAKGYLTTYYYDNSARLVDSIITNQNTYYAKNVGIIVQEYHYYNDLKEYKRRFEKRLIRYKLKD